MALKIIWGDIVNERTDAVVTLASQYAKVGCGVDKSVHKAAGPELLKERLSKEGKMGPGIVVVTKPYGLSKTCGAKNVIHVSSILWEGGGRNEELLLDAAYLKAVVVANALEHSSVTIPVMGAGKFGMEKKAALNRAVKSLRECARYFPDMELKLVTVEAEIFDYAREAYGTGKWPIACESHFSAEEESKFRKLFPTPNHVANEELMLDPFLENGSNAYWKGVKVRQFASIGGFCETFAYAYRHVIERDKLRHAELLSSCEGNACGDKMTELNDKLDDCEKLIRDMYDLQNLSGVSYWTIRHIVKKDKKYGHPSRDIVLALCVAMKLPIPYVKVLMGKCGYSFGASACDKMVINYMRNGEYEVEFLNDLIGRQLGGDSMLNLVGSRVTNRTKQKSNKKMSKCRAVKAKCPICKRA